MIYGTLILADDEDAQHDLFDNSDNEGDGEDNEEEVAWRKQRYERERFLEEQKVRGKKYFRMPCI